ncbi:MULTISPECIES: ABC transporter permease [Vibrio]|jgi:peptide/nickel transport system permease protein|uniref:ABC transporter permease n=1 Tax=Vibrio natriegens NBRC 15636 = ATCC 14048 = DSM 759 TaxID=1219067 RepID=A0AAN0Y8A8_VIBNA|nr:MULTISPECIES: ABC transporter permease [Vibrio]MEE3877565.1 ABC transporter permease [Vibrio sp. YYF0003]AEX25224.1 dipeptide/oligopeptide/nickel ABC transporter permease [Vibrio sp. EJY3]ALR17489.1 ABC transporter permease [Vibrio natriegens NBRC 15636 = ATCC 14048 = DSM 759]ANQ14980.1 ABC transporter permease [Vibrio natriegens NBRC 15636 = ATCC 14048 = DSM 759]ANQ18616.1 ABC transporter permease [Vibrio natriegens]
MSSFFLYIGQRLAAVFTTLLVVSILVFVVIDLPPGDFASAKIAEMAAMGQDVDPEQILVLREMFGLDKPLHERYISWMGGLLTGDLGLSLVNNKPVWDNIQPTLLPTILLACAVLVFKFTLAIPIGVYSALRQYSFGDYIATIFGFIGMATPNFVIAIVALLIGYHSFDVMLSGLYSPEYISQPMSFDKFMDGVSRSWLYILVAGTAGMAGIIRIMRANLLDELTKPYVKTARAKGQKEFTLLVKYPIRVACLPLAATIGWQLPLLISADVIVSQVLNIPTMGPTMLSALRNQDMYLAGDILLLMSTLTIIGTIISDLIMYWVDPRVRAGL